MRPVIGITTSTLQGRAVASSEQPRFGLYCNYVERVQEAGGLPLMLPSVLPGEAASYVARLDGLLLSGGVDVDPSEYGVAPHPRLGEVDKARDAFELALVRAAHAAHLPILAICRGMQVANVAFGGTLVQDIPSELPGAGVHSPAGTAPSDASHPVRLEAGTGLQRLAGEDEVVVNSFHHQSVQRVAPLFRITARAQDGVVEGMEALGGAFFQCVQWHPERLGAEALTRSLFREFMAEAARVRA